MRMRAACWLLLVGCAAGPAGPAVEQGPTAPPLARDFDGDGIEEPRDRCPREPGAVAMLGCPGRDGDSDRVLGADDRCPRQRETWNGYLDGDGCPDALPAELAAIEGIVRAVFDPNKDVLRRESFAAIDPIVTVLTRYREVRVEISGHTDAPNPREHGNDLDRRRAEAVKGYLVSQGVEASRIRVRAAGNEEPLDSNATEAGRRRNRRVELAILKEPPGP